MKGVRDDLRNDLKKMLKRATRIKYCRNIKVLDRELFLRCKPIKRYIEKQNIPEVEAYKLPPVIIGGLLSNKSKIGITRVLEPPIAPKLEKALLKVGEIGTKVGKNTVGNCAEVDCANYLLLNSKSTDKVLDIIFTTPYRPRTSQVMPTCDNCKKTFN